MTDEIDKYIAKTQADKKLLRKAIKTERKPKINFGRASRNKGGKDERGFEDDYFEFGFIKTADSGSSSQLPDIQRPIEGNILCYGEKKFRRSGGGWKTLNTWMEQNQLNQFLVLDCRLGERLWVIKDSIMRYLLQEAGYDSFTSETKGFDRWSMRARKRQGLQKYVDKKM